MDKMRVFINGVEVNQPDFSAYRWFRYDDPKPKAKLRKRLKPPNRYFVVPLTSAFMDCVFEHNADLKFTFKTPGDALRAVNETPCQSHKVLGEDYAIVEGRRMVQSGDKSRRFVFEHRKAGTD